MVLLVASMALRICVLLADRFLAQLNVSTLIQLLEQACVILGLHRLDLGVIKMRPHVVQLSVEHLALHVDASLGH